MLVTLFEPLLTFGLPALGLTLCVLLFTVDEIGYRVGRWRVSKGPVKRELPGVGVITTGMLGLLAFTLGLTISIAQSRFDARRGLVLTEANAIGTAWHRAGLVPTPEGPAIRGLLQGYARLRLDYTIAPPGQPAQVERLNHATGEHQAQIWAQMEQLAARLQTPLVASLSSALDTCFDAATAQRFAFESRVPPEILWMLLGGAVLAIGSMGFQFGLAGHRLPVMTALLIAMWVMGMLLIVDLSRARDGSIRADPRPLQWLLENFPASAR